MWRVQYAYVDKSICLFNPGDELLGLGQALMAVCLVTALRFGSGSNQHRFQYSDVSRAPTAGGSLVVCVSTHVVGQR